ncbi:MAG: HIT domain-containing protein [Rickettsiales bacterium]|jgi:diadenosine tetraphosphate (Ap4A) HIT family hydrolase|nr:HIT domain-containing protein [Rickettsiales bacterium]
MQRKYDENNVFNKIIKGVIPTSKVYEDADFLAFYDIDPKAPVHILLISKKDFVSFDDFAKESDGEYIAKFFKTAQKIAEEKKLSSYRIVANCGAGAEQAVFHFHLHIMGYLE